MQSLKIIRRRISSVKSTQKVTKAMKLVAAAKLKRAQRDAISARSYTDGLRSIIKRISMHGQSSPLMQQRKEIKTIDILVLTSDRGLCGNFNEKLLLYVLNEIKKHASHGINIFVVGKKGWQYFGRRGIKATQLTNVDITDTLTKRFLDHKSDGAILAFNRFFSTARQVPTLWNFLPLYWSEPVHSPDYIYEPKRDEVIDSIVRVFLQQSVEQAVREAAASELAARLLAMDKATKNAGDMIEHLTLEYHKARQAAITTELLDIVGGAEALQ